MLYAVAFKYFNGIVVKFYGEFDDYFVVVGFKDVNKIVVVLEGMEDVIDLVSDEVNN